MRCSCIPRLTLCKPPVSKNVNAIAHYQSSSDFEHHFAVIRCYGTETVNVWLFLHHLDFPKGKSFRGSIRPAGCFLAANNSENSDDAQRLPVGAAAGSSCQVDGAM